MQSLLPGVEKNFGKGPALAAVADTRIVTSGVDNNTQSSCNLILPFIGLKPNWSSQFSLKIIPEHRWGQAIFPGQPFIIVVDYSGGNVVNPVGKEAYVVGCIAYKDQFSDAHWSKFCYNTGDFAAQIVHDATSFKHLYTCNTNNYTDEIEKK